jgi:hypothetical protein
MPQQDFSGADAGCGGDFAIGGDVSQDGHYANGAS